MDEKIRLLNRLKVARAEKNLSQEQLAALAGVTRQTISAIETGQYCPTARLALVLSRKLNKKFEELFYLENDINPSSHPGEISMLHCPSKAGVDDYLEEDER